MTRLEVGYYAAEHFVINVASGNVAVSRSIGVIGVNHIAEASVKRIIDLIGLFLDKLFDIT